MANIKYNNFDLIRLFAALQVALIHSAYHINVDEQFKALLGFLELLPGVPIFFFVSGFLISLSYEKNSILKEYGLNRFLRIYPALVICILLSFLSVYLVGYLSDQNFVVWRAIAWLAGQLTFFQFYNPDFMRGYGVGVLNGSLWTITVELQFYLIVPVLYLFISNNKKNSNFYLLTLIIIFLVFNQFYLFREVSGVNTITHKLLGVSFIPWFYMFLVGVFAQRNFLLLVGYFQGRFFLFFLTYLCLSSVLHHFFGFQLGNRIGPFLYLMLIPVLISAAYSLAGLSNRVLRKNDFSYGIYIYHMPVVNYMVYNGFSGQSSYFALALLFTVVLSFLSWWLVEKPCLGLKTHPMHALK